jgi:hypothetical protein
MFNVLNICQSSIAGDHRSDRIEIEIATATIGKPSLARPAWLTMYAGPPVS